MITEAGEEAMTRARSWHTAKLTPAMRGPDSKHEFEVKGSTGRGTLSGTILILKSTAKVDGQSKGITSHVHFNGGLLGTARDHGGRIRPSTRRGVESVGPYSIGTSELGEVGP